MPTGEVKLVYPDDYSLASYYLETRINSLLLAHGTCFFYNYNQQSYLITNWHIAAGRDPNTGITLHPSAAVPDEMRVRILKKNQENNIEWGFFNIPLIDKEGNKLWLDLEVDGRMVDVVAIPLECPNDLYFLDIGAPEELFNENTTVRIGDEIFIIGFPFGLDYGGGLPIWKRGSLASEPEADVEDMPKIYIDTATRPGMSGSPVIFKRRRAVTVMSETEKTMSRYLTKFIGVYSGRIGAEDLNKIQLGVVWKASIITDIIKKNFY